MSTRTITLRNTKGSPLTFTELDNNVDGLDTDLATVEGDYVSKTTDTTITAELTVAEILSTGQSYKTGPTAAIALTGGTGTHYVNIGTIYSGYHDLRITATGTNAYHAVKASIIQGFTSSADGNGNHTETELVRLERGNGFGEFVNLFAEWNTADSATIYAQITAPPSGSATYIFELQGLTVSTSNTLTGTSSTTTPGLDALVPHQTISAGGIDVTGTVTLDDTLNISGGSTTAFVQASGTLFQVGASTASDLVAYTNNAERLRITSAGNVGIGTSSPNARLDVVSESVSDVAIKITDAQAETGGSQDYNINMITKYAEEQFTLYNTDTYRNMSWIGFDNFGQEITFGTGAAGSSAQRMVIDNSGNVGIGVAAPTNAKLEVVASSGEVFRADASGGAYRIVANQTDVLLNGNVGIGTASPDYDLEIEGATNEFRITDTGANSTYARVATAANSATLQVGRQGGNFSVGSLVAKGNGSYLALDNVVSRVGVIESESNGDLSFSIDDGTNDTEFMRLDYSSGNVGIGITNPAYKLVVSNGGASGIEFGPAYSGTSNLIQHYNRSGAAYVDAVNIAAQHRFAIGGTEAMRINSSGDVGIGESAPTTRLHVKGSAVQVGRIVSTGTGGSYLTFEDADTTAGQKAWIGADGDLFKFYSNNTTLNMTMTTSGNVGIGTSNPGVALDVVGTTDPTIRVLSSGTGASDDTILRSQIGGTAASNYLYFGDADDNNAGQIRYVHSDDSMRFYAGATTERLRLYSTASIFYNGATEIGRFHSNNNFGIGTASPANNLHVNSSGNTVAKISSTFSGSTTTGLYIDTVGDTSAARLLFSKSGVTRGIIGYSHNATANSEAITFGTAGGTERMRIDATGIDVTGTIVGDGLDVTVGTDNRTLLREFNSVNNLSSVNAANTLFKPFEITALGTTISYGGTDTLVAGNNTVNLYLNSGSLSHGFSYNENGGELVLYDDTGTAATLFDQSNNNTRLLELIDGSNIQVGLGGSNTTGALLFTKASGAEFGRITGSGYFGINNTNPDTTLHIGDLSATNATGQGRIKLEDSAASLAADGGLEFVGSGFGSGYGWKMNAIDPGGGVHLDFGVRQNSTTWTHVARFDGNGTVAIGDTTTNNTANRLKVKGTTIDSRIAMSSNGTTGTATIEAQVENYWSGTTYTGTAIIQNDSAAGGTTAGLSNANLGELRFQNGSNALIYTNGSTPIVFATASTERARITSSGKFQHSGLRNTNAGVTATGKTLTDGENVTVTAATQTITLPASPAAGDQVQISVGDFTDTVVARNGSNIMGLAENLTIDTSFVGLTLIYSGDATQGWRVF